MSVNLLPESNVVNATINELLKGRANNVGEVTLEDGVTTTQVIDTRITLTAKVFLSPRTANAAGAIATTYVSDVADGSFTLTHANAVSTDRTFDYVFHA